MELVLTWWCSASNLFRTWSNFLLFYTYEVVVEFHVCFHQSLESPQTKESESFDPGRQDDVLLSNDRGKRQDTGGKHPQRRGSDRRSRGHLLPVAAMEAW
jgi:hypothetical protein